VGYQDRGVWMSDGGVRKYEEGRREFMSLGLSFNFMLSEPQAMEPVCPEFLDVEV
jgi:hypothetical protein